MRLSTGKLLVRRDHPCYRDGLDSGLWWKSKTCTNANGVHQILLDEAGNIASSADHYREIRVAEPWRVPQIFGHIPQLPTELSTATARGKYALFAMLLFRPWRAPGAALAEWLGPPRPEVAGEDSADRVGQALHEEFTRWRETLRVHVREYRASPEARQHPTPSYSGDSNLASPWWSAMTLRRLDHLELFCGKPTPTKMKPETLDGLPLGSDSESARSEKASDEDSDDKVSE